ncbi:MAG: SocA family protein, partial [Deltaproteobacteria bacterium]|nr:SocA family protein [Deltaproteobacteria bacterium]
IVMSSILEIPTSIKFEFDERKATEAACLLLQRANNRLPYLKLIKMLYLADRMSLKQYGEPITGDRYVAMKYGPVLSNVFDLIKEDIKGEFWSTKIKKDKFDSVLIADFSPKALCEADVEILTKCSDFCQQYDRWDLVDIVHKLPEWQDPGETSTPISVESILKVFNKSDEEIEEIRQEASDKLYFHQMLTGA